MSFTKDIAKVDGVALAAHNAGEVPAHVKASSDKTGYSLTAGSYSVRASSSQRATAAIAGVATADASISSVTTTRASAYWAGWYGSANIADPLKFPRMQLTAATTVTGVRETSDAAATNFGVEVAEFF